MKRILLFLFLLFVLPRVADATDYYVTQDGSGDHNGLSYASSMSVSEHNSGSFSPGDTIFLCGIMNSQVTVPSSGTAGNVITYSGACPGNPGHLKGTGSQDTTGVHISGKGYLTFENLEISEWHSGMWANEESHDITVKRCSIHDTTSRGLAFVALNPKYGGSGIGCDNILIGGAPGDGNEIYDVGMDTAGGDIDILSSHDIVVSYNHLYATKSGISGSDDRGIDGVVTEYTHNLLIEHNSIHDHNDAFAEGESSTLRGKGEDGIDLKKYTHNVTIRYNDIYNHNYQTGITVQMDSYDVRIYENRIWNNGAGVLVFDHGTSGWPQPNGHYVNNVSVWGNLIYGNGGGGVTIFNGDADGVNDVYVYNNVLAGNGANSKYTDDSFNYKVTVGTGHVMKNNILYMSRPNRNDYVQAYVKNAGVTIDHNQYYWPGHTSRTYWKGSYYDSVSVPGQESSGSEGDAGFADAGSNDYRLLETSPCIGTGEALGQEYSLALDPSTDWSTTPPTVVTASQDDYGPGWERGAYVYTAGATQTYSCTGSIPSSAIAYDSEESTGLAADTPWTYSSTDTTTKCQYRCNSGYSWDRGVCLQEPPPVGEYNYSILKTHTQPAIDGDLSEFSGAPAITITEPATGASGTYRLMWDEQALYIAASFQDTQLNAVHTDNDSWLWEDDSLEMMLDTLHDKGSSIRQDDYKFFVNVRGAHMDSKAYDSNWDSGLASEVVVSGTLNQNSDTDTGYVVEARIPWWVAGPGVGDAWGMNIKLNDLTASGKYSDPWSQSGLDVNAPDGWNDVLFTVRADTSRDGCMDMAELTDFIDLWHADSAANTMSELMEVVALWRGGCF